MANTFKNSITGSIGTTGVKVYETPVGSSSTVIGVNVANTATQNAKPTPITIFAAAANATVNIYGSILKNCFIYFMLNDGNTLFRTIRLTQ